MSVAPPTLAATNHPAAVPPAASSEPDATAFSLPGTPAAPGPGIPDVPLDLSGLTTRELRILCNQVYRVLDTDHPPFGVQDDYETLVEALAEREAQAAERSESEGLREKFRDNRVSSRFELFHDGTLVGYVKYDMRAGRIRLLETVVGTAHRMGGLEPVLIREALLNAHRRRLAPVPYCPHAQAFLQDNPQFRALIPVS